MVKRQIKVHRRLVQRRGNRRWGLLAKGMHHFRRHPFLALRHPSTKPKTTDVADNTLPTPADTQPEKSEAAQPQAEEHEDPIPAAQKGEEKPAAEASPEKDDSGPKNFEREERPKAAEQPTSSDEHGGEGGTRKNPVQAEVPKPEVKAPEETPQMAAGVPD